jgi:hypothetical protein
MNEKWNNIYDNYGAVVKEVRYMQRVNKRRRKGEKKVKEIFEK